MQLRKPFNVIAISETWLTADKVTNIELDGYEITCMNRKCKKGGGVALYVENSFMYGVVDSMTVSIDNILACLTIEICMEKMKNIVVSCVYRTPESNIEMFSNMEEVFSKATQKSI